MKDKIKDNSWKHYLQDSKILFSKIGFTWIGKEANETMVRLQKAHRDSHLLDFDNLALRYLNASPLWFETNKEQL